MSEKVYVLQGMYAPREWDDILTESTKKEIYEQLACYNENEPDTPHRVVTRRGQKKCSL